MGSIAFDTLSTSEDLQKAGVAAPQAKAITLAIASVQGDLATRADLESVRDDVESVRSELTAKIESVRSELNDKIESVRSELNEKIDGLRSEMRWAFGFLFALNLLVLGTVMGVLFR